MGISRRSDGSRLADYAERWGSVIEKTPLGANEPLEFEPAGHGQTMPDASSALNGRRECDDGGNACADMKLFCLTNSWLIKGGDISYLENIRFRHKPLEAMIGAACLGSTYP